VVQAFVEWVRQGNISRGFQIRAGSIQDSISAIWQDLQIGWPPKPPIPNRINCLPHQNQATTGSLQKKRPTNTTTVSHTSGSLKLDILAIPKIHQATHQSNQRIVSNHLLLFTMSRQIHTNTCNTPDSDPTILAKGYMLFL